MKLLGSVCLKERYQLSITCKVSSLWLQVLVCLVYCFCLFGVTLFCQTEKRNDNSLLVVVCASSQQGQIAEYSMPFPFPHCPAVMPSPQRRKEKHMANIKFPSTKTKQGTATDLRLTLWCITPTGLQLWQDHIERWRRRSLMVGYFDLKSLVTWFYKIIILFETRSNILPTQIQ